MVVLRNCQTQLSTYSNRMEVLLESFSKIEESKAEMDIKDNCYCRSRCDMPKRIAREGRLRRSYCAGESNEGVLRRNCG